MPGILQTMESTFKPPFTLRSWRSFVLASCVLQSAVLIDAVAETRIRVHGVPGMDEGEVLSLLGGRLYQIRNSPATPARADDAAFLLRQMLRQDGSANASVAWRINGPDEIVLTASGAARLVLGEVTILGGEEKDRKRLATLFGAPFGKDRSYGSGDLPFREPDVATGLSYLIQDYQANGHWTATAVEEHRATDPATGKVAIRIRVRPGPLHTLAAPAVTASDAAARTRVAAAAKPWQGLPATTAHLNAMRSAVEDSFSSAGFANAKIAMASRIETPRFIPEFTVTQGARIKLRHLTVSGFTKTNPHRVQQRLKPMEGGWFDKTALSQRQRELLATGAFSSVRTEITPVDAGTVDAHLSFAEGNARELTLAAGAGSYDGPIFRILYGDRNLFGQVIGLSAGFEFTARGVLGDVRVTNPWLLGSDWAGTARLYSIIYGHEGYTSFDTGLEGILSRKFTDHFKVEFLLGYSFVDNSEDGLPSYALGDNAYQHTRLRATPVWDYRDSALLPTAGWALRTPLQIGSAVGDDAAAYASLGVNGAWYRKLSANYQLALLGQCGLLVPTGDALEFPIDLRYFNGGADTVRSFPERELGPTINGYATGGNAYWAANAELIRPLAGPLNLVGFLDAGALSLDYQDILDADIELAAGLGVRLDLPIGPVRFEYGYNLTRGRDEPAGAFHFAIGASF
jgi:outer membrane protein assembly factor BamA